MNDKLASCVSPKIRSNLHAFDTFQNLTTFKNKEISSDIIPEEKSKDKIFLDYNNDNDKKKKKRNEMDIISLNIKKSSQNLNQPDLFYADLFNHLIFKKNHKFHSSSKILKNSIILENNEEMDIEEEKNSNHCDDNNLL